MIKIQFIILITVNTIYHLITKSIGTRKKSEIDFHLFKSAKRKQLYENFLNKKIRKYSIIGTLINITLVFLIDKLGLDKVCCFKIIILIFGLINFYDIWVSKEEYKILKRILKNEEKSEVY